jgi:NAD dependent epimerase/dehydratase family enzyme
MLRLVLGEMSTMVLDGQRASSKKLTDLGFNFLYEDIESALKDIL